MNQSTTHQAKRQLRRVIGPAALSTLAEQAARIAILETFVARLHTSMWRRLVWLVTGKVSA